MKLLLGTRLYVDFPTLDGVIYPRPVVEAALNESRHKIDSGLILGGIFDEACPTTPKENMTTHYVTDILIYNDEVAVELETIETAEIDERLAEIKNKRAAIIIKVPTDQGAPGTTVRKIVSIEAVHIREDKYAQPNGSDSKN